MINTNLRVKELLKENGWTTKMLAEKTGMSESYLTHIKNGTRRWNEDSLKKIAEAFCVDPISLLCAKEKDALKNKEALQKSVVAESNSKEKTYPSIKLLPMMADIPLYPSDYNNQYSQVTTGYKDEFFPVAGVSDENAFCLVMENYSLAPIASKGDILVVAPGRAVNSGDLVAVEFKNDKSSKQIMKINFVNNLIMLEYLNHKSAPVAIVKNKDYLRIIGKVVKICQKFG